MEEQEKNDCNGAEKKILKKSKDDMNGVIGGLVLGLLFAFISYQIYIHFIQFPIASIDVYYWIFGDSLFYDRC